MKWFFLLTMIVSAVECDYFGREKDVVRLEGGTTTRFVARPAVTKRKKDFFEKLAAWTNETTEMGDGTKVTWKMFAGDGLDDLTSHFRQNMDEPVKIASGAKPLRVYIPRPTTTPTATSTTNRLSLGTYKATAKPFALTAVKPTTYKPTASITKQRVIPRRPTVRPWNKPTYRPTTKVWMGQYKPTQTPKPLLTVAESLAVTTTTSPSTTTTWLTSTTTTLPPNVINVYDYFAETAFAVDDFIKRLFAGRVGWSELGKTVLSGGGGALLAVAGVPALAAVTSLLGGGPSAVVAAVWAVPAFVLFLNGQNVAPDERTQWS